MRFKISIFLLFFLFMNGCSSSGVNDPNQFVNPFIGTSGGGNTFPGALVPWGMVSVSPHTDLKAPSGYIHGEPYFYGFGQVHLSGTG
ncbi:MAG TPA: glycoside hydrolase family 92 protein, partial [Candidatus Marinimicrobia bacterium]|nr:glycoside hydrolase family 92 protein [Candidatus Neomarinimicrobiota bacterium]